MTGNKPTTTSGSAAARPVRRPSASPKKGKKKVKIHIVILKVLLFIILCLGVFLFTSQLGYNYITAGSKASTEAVPVEKQETLTIPSGAHTLEIAELLKEKGFIKNIQFYRLMSKVIGFDGLYKAGRHIISKDMNEYALMVVLTGDPLRNPTQDVRIPEGVSLMELADTLAAPGAADDGKPYFDKEKFLSLCRQKLPAYDFLTSLNVKTGRSYVCEGYLYPDTYKMDAGWNEEQLVLRMLDEFNRQFKPEWRERAKELNMTLDEVVTLASIIQMETKFPVDYKKVSSVFHNRLKSKNMPYLQTDASIQYARILAGEGRTETVLYKDLEIDSPYNSYKNAGLPPGPICSPRKDAIEAALYPATTKYLYFFAKPDGTNVYNETFDGHTRDQKKYGVSGGN